MKLAAVVALAFALGACSPSQDQQAHQTEEKAKHDAKVALADAKVDAEKANRVLDKDLSKAREKLRGALNQPNDAPPDTHR